MLISVASRQPCSSDTASLVHIFTVLTVMDGSVITFPKVWLGDSSISISNVAVALVQNVISSGDSD